MGTGAPNRGEFFILKFGGGLIRGEGCSYFPPIKVQKNYFGKNSRTDHTDQGGGVPSRGVYLPRPKILWTPKEAPR